MSVNFFRNMRLWALMCIRLGKPAAAVMTRAGAADFPDIKGDTSLDRWIKCGLPVFEIPDKRAAVLQATRCSAELMGSLVAPFGAFGILLSQPIGTLQPFALISHACSTWDIAAALVDGSHAVHERFSDAELLEDTSGSIARVSRSGGSQPVDLSDRRSMLCLRRLIVGLLLTLDHSGLNFGCSRQSVKTDDRKSLSHYELYRITGSVSIDCRRYVSDFIKNGAEHPSVRMLVCGHWKMQPFGPGRAQRKHIHVEPYWRGPEDAPLALRLPND